VASPGGSGSLLDPDELVRACTASGVPGLVPHPAQSLTLVPKWVLRQLDASLRGVIVLGVDGLSWSKAATCWHAAELACLTSTFPTTSATAWLTALTGVGPGEHLAAANSYLVPALGTVVNAVTAQPITWPGQALLPLEAGPDTQLVAPHPTLFERATQQGATCVAVTRELDGLPGPWAHALLRGADRWDGGKTSASVLQAQVTDPRTLATGVIADVEQVLAQRPGARDTLVWVYVNLDDYVHLHGYDRATEQALQTLETAANRWADKGWTVVAHADHGQIRRIRDQGLEAVWTAVDTPALCAFPGAGAGRARWLYPRPGKAAEVAERLRQGLGTNALVLSASDLIDRGLLPGVPGLLERVGEVVALALTERFPLEDPDMRYEHGSVHPDEMLVPLATWPSTCPHTSHRNCDKLTIGQDPFRQLEYLTPPERLHDKTVRRHWEQARKVNIKGEEIKIEPGNPLADAQWVKHRVGLATQALPNGFCGLPIQQTCPHANACLTCPVFVTTPEFLDKHREHREQTRRLLATAKANGQLRLAEMNQRVLDSLDQIIPALEDGQDPQATLGKAAGAR
jgi:ferredoxin